ncbi:hypothetical protein Tco_0410691 [Tanacetum coccineum]
MKSLQSSSLQLKWQVLEQEMSDVKEDRTLLMFFGFQLNPFNRRITLCYLAQIPLRNKNLKRSPNGDLSKIKKREQGEEKQDTTYSISQQTNLLFEEFDLKSAHYEDAMDKEVAVKVKDHKRKHDSDDEEDDDDDEGPLAGSNQGRSAKRKRPNMPLFGSAQKLLRKNDDQSLKKPRESDASASKQHLALTSTGWQITDTRDDPIPEGERPATPEPEWTIPPNDFPEPKNNWANTYATMYQVTAKNKLQRKTYDIGSFIKWFCRRTGKKKLLQRLIKKVAAFQPWHGVLGSGIEYDKRRSKDITLRTEEKTTDHEDLSNVPRKALLEEE